MVGLKGRMGSGSEERGVPARGFQFAQSEYQAFRDEATFRAAVREQSESLVLLDAAHLTRVDIDGRLTDFGEDWRLTRLAFGQLCHHSNVPVSYVTDLALRNETLALEVMAEGITGRFRRSPRQLVVNTRSRLIEGVYDEFQFDPLSNERLLDYMLSCEGDQRLTRAWIEGPDARMTVVNRLRVLEPKVGDIVHVGVDAQTRLGQRYLASFDLYNERLSCTNGMCSRSKTFTHRVDRDAGDVEFQAQRAAVRVGEGSRQLQPMMEAAARLHMGEEAVDSLVDRLQDPKRGGSRDLFKRTVATADRERRSDGREDGDYTLWDFVNGVTDAAKFSKSIGREAELEGLGYAVMGEYLSKN
jgi:hypothetical protein